MEVNNVKTVNYLPSTAQSTVAESQETNQSTLSANTTGAMEGTGSKNRNEHMSAQEIYLEAAKNLSKEDMSLISRELSRFMELLNADIQFSLHEKSQRLIVQVVDMDQKKVLKEFPPHELLDTMAKIREYVGVLLDKKV